MSHSHNIVDSGNHFVIDPISRTVTAVAEEVVLVQGDHNSERYTFEIPKMIDGHDMSMTDRIEIHYDNIAKNKKEFIEGLYIADGLVVNGDTLEFGWLITENVTKLAGSTQFWINFICLDDDDNIIYSWGTETYKSIRILPSNDNTQNVIAKFPDVLSQWKQEVFDGIEANGESCIKFLESPNKDGRMLCLRDLESGMYVLYGRFKPYSSATFTYSFSNCMLASIIRDDDVSYVQVLYSKNNTIQYFEITDESVLRKDAKLSDMQTSTNLAVVVDETSDHEHYPSAKAVYDLLNVNESRMQTMINEALSTFKPDTDGSDVTDDKIAQAVANYMASNPIVTESDATIGVVELPSANWVGDNRLYSQVVSIEGVTENSQVDITPSVEQLVVFYEKDLTFVTENDGGVVTVYAIGQKPENDYVLQVTITEVNI